MRYLLSLMIFALLACSALGAEKLVSQDWQVMLMGSQRIGWATTSTKRLDSGELKIRQETRMKFRRFSQEITLETVLETIELDSGEMKSFEFVLRNPPNRPTIQKGAVSGNRLELDLTVGGRSKTETILLPPNTRSPLLQDRFLGTQRLKPGLIASFQTWQPELSKPATLKFRVDGQRQTELFDGTRESLYKVYVENSAVPTLRLRGYVDEAGTWKKTETDFFGKQLTTYLVSEEEALKELAGGELDLALASMIRVESLRDPHRSTQVTYKMMMEDDDPSRYFQTDIGQVAKKVDDNTLLLTVSKTEEPSRSSIRRDPQNRDEYLASTNFLQSDDIRVKTLARRGAAGTVDPLRIARQMEALVLDKVKSKNFSTALASAAEVAEDLQGDCTEHAMLLAAMLRAENIPSRVAIGFVYSNQIGGFAGHMWTEAWIRDRWVPLDATLGKGGISGGHLKLSDSSLSENAAAPVTEFLPMMNLLGKLKIEVVEQN